MAPFIINRSYILFFTAVLLIILHLKEEGELKTAQSCTEVLQSFHCPAKRHVSSPIKASALGRGITDEDDPRPDEYKNNPGYQDMVNMLTVNYCWSTGRDVSWRYKFGKCNIQQAAQDHDYEKLLLTEI